MRVDLLFQHAKIISHHHDLVEKSFKRNFIGLQRCVGGFQNEHSFLPAVRQFFHMRVVLFQIEFVNERAHGFGDQIAERNIESANFRLSFGGFQFALFGSEGAQAGVESHIDHVFGKTFDGAGSVFRMLHLHSDVHGLDCHGGNVFCGRESVTKFFKCGNRVDRRILDL